VLTKELGWYLCQTFNDPSRDHCPKVYLLPTKKNLKLVILVIQSLLKAQKFKNSKAFSSFNNGLNN
jgi:hypothetical protein